MNGGWPNRDVGLLYSESAEGDGSVSDEATEEERTAISDQTFARHVAGCFPAGRCPAHNDAKIQKWCQVSLSCFWAKGARPGNSPDLSTIENLCAIVQHKVDKMATATSEVNLIRNVRSAWRSTSSETLDNPKITLLIRFVQ